MKKFVVAAIGFALLIAPAAAQMGGRRNAGEDKPKADTGRKIDDKAYKAALERIPEPKEKYDPWGGVAPTPAAKKTK